MSKRYVITFYEDVSRQEIIDYYEIIKCYDGELIEDIIKMYERKKVIFSIGEYDQAIGQYIIDDDKNEIMYETIMINVMPGAKPERVYYDGEWHFNTDRP